LTRTNSRLEQLNSKFRQSHLKRRFIRADLERPDGADADIAGQQKKAAHSDSMPSAGSHDRDRKPIETHRQTPTFQHKISYGDRRRARQHSEVESTRKTLFASDKHNGFRPSFCSIEALVQRKQHRSI